MTRRRPAREIGSCRTPSSATARTDTPDDREPLGYDDIWRKVLTGTEPQMRVGRWFLRRIPGEPRCKLCAAPLRGPASPLMRIMGKGPWPKNPKFCGSCFEELTEHHGGAEIECSLMFADVRGSTSIAESMRPSSVHRLMDRFFDTAARVLVEHDAIVDRFVGDQAIGIFVPALTGANHAGRAVQAAQALVAATGHNTGEPWVPVGAGVHTGIAFVGSVGSAAHVDFTAIGDTVNVAARLSSSAGSGEILVTIEAARAAGLDPTRYEHRDLLLRGRTTRTSAVVVVASGLPSPPSSAH